ncbi:MAG: phosphotransferase [Lachnospiraceae bacterium]|nr:phosphotransferase [Lachnospiraceae bacterium]
MFEDIEGSKTWRSIKKIAKGWSTDEKYLIITEEGQKQLLRISPIDTYEGKKKEFEIIEKYSKTGINMSRPISFGKCNQRKNTYMLLSWVEGPDLERVLPTLPEAKQYQLGRDAGMILRKIHSIEVEQQDVPQTTKKEKKLRQLQLYEDSKVRVEHDEPAIQYVKDNIWRIWKEKPVYEHGDFHPGNLIYMEDGSIGVIDFNRWEVGDPYEEFLKLESFVREISIPYCIGQIDAYFDDDIPEDFWNVHAVYAAHAALYSIKWAEKFGQEDIDRMQKRCITAFEDFENFRRVIPVWYARRE